MIFFVQNFLPPIVHFRLMHHFQDLLHLNVFTFIAVITAIITSHRVLHYQDAHCHIVKIIKYLFIYFLLKDGKIGVGK